MYRTSDFRRIIGLLVPAFFTFQLGVLSSCNQAGVDNRRLMSVPEKTADVAAAPVSEGIGVFQPDKAKGAWVRDQSLALSGQSEIRMASEGDGKKVVIGGHGASKGPLLLRVAFKEFADSKKETIGYVMASCLAYKGKNKSGVATFYALSNVPSCQVKKK